MIDNQFMSALRTRFQSAFASLNRTRVIALAAATIALAVFVVWPQTDASVGAAQGTASVPSDRSGLGSESPARLADVAGAADSGLAGPQEGAAVSMNGGNLMTMGTPDAAGPSWQAKLLGVASLLTILLSWRVLRRTRQSRARFGSRRFSPDSDRMLRIMCQVSPQRDEANIGRITAMIHALTGDTVPEQYVADLLEAQSVNEDEEDIATLAAEIAPENTRLAMQGALMVAWRRGKFSAAALKTIGRLACVLRLDEDDVTDLFSTLPDPSQLLTRA